MPLPHPGHQRAPLSEQAAGWKQRLDVESPFLEALLDNPRPPVPLFLKAAESVQLPHHLYRRLETFCSREKDTLFNTLLATLKGILFRYTGHSDITIGSLSTDSVHLTGPHEGEIFVNPVALYTNLAGSLTGTELLQRVSQTVVQAAAHRDYPFEEMADLVGVEQRLNRSPIFQIMFALLGQPFCVSPTPASADDLVEIGAHIARCDLMVTAVKKDSQLCLTCEYDVALFEAETIQRLFSHFLVFLEGIITEPTVSLWQLPLLTEVEQQQLLVAWNQTEQDYPRHLCVHQLFEAQTEKTPDAVAVTCGAEQLTYQELNGRANCLARHLQARGVRPNTLVGICIERSLDLVVGLLGILKAGGAYVPLDPTLPGERLSFMLAKAGATVLLTRQKQQIPILRHQTQVVYIDAHWPDIRQESAENPISTVTADDLIYVIYTSGSTGRPKGAGVFHRGFANLLHWFITEFDITAADRVLLVTPIGFDLAQKNVYAPLAMGGQLHLLPTQFFEAAVVRQRIEGDRITLLNCTPSAFYLVLEDVDPNALSRLTSLRYLFLGGEPIAMARLQPWISAAGVKTEIVNTYGPTECTDVCAFHRLADPQRYLETAVPIGKPISNTQLLILDENGQLVPVGVAGELCISGDGVGMGYLNDAPLTATSFIPHPFTLQEEGVLMYRTGDLACWRADGAIEFRGRKDHQVKLRGYRIELGEIESTLNQHASVAQSAAVVHENGPTDQRLIAYVVPAPGSVPHPRELRRYLKTRLPDYMLPAAFVQMDAFPLTPNGKIARQALPVPEQSSSIPEDAFTAPRSPVEELVAEMWAQVLGVTPVGIHDNFFALGGHSLLAVQIIAQVRRVFHVELSLRHLFQATTVAELAHLIVANERQPGQVGRIAKLLKQIQDMSPDQRRAVLAQKRNQKRMR